VFPVRYKLNSYYMSLRRNTVFGGPTNCCILYVRGKIHDRGVAVRVAVGSRSLNFSVSFRPALVPSQPPIQWVQDALLPGVKRQWREAGHSPPTRAPIRLHCLVLSYLSTETALPFLYSTDIELH
jgi:hypothetical protein